MICDFVTLAVAWTLTDSAAIGYLGERRSGDGDTRTRPHRRWYGLTFIADRDAQRIRPVPRRAGRPDQLSGAGLRLGVTTLASSRGEHCDNAGG